MKNRIFALFFVIGISFSVLGQTNTYVTTGGEMIFSFASIKDNGFQDNSLMRWAPVFNFQSMLNHDLSNNFGVFTGLALRNVGYIYDHYNLNYQDPGVDKFVKKKFRSYNVGVPVGIKVGNLDNFFIYGGYEVEFPFLYKEKTFDQGDKIEKITGWFSKREEWLQHGFLAGIQFKNGINLKFKYYMSEFHNQDFVDYNGSRPYSGIESHIFYFSFSSYLFKNTKYYSPVNYRDI